MGRNASAFAYARGSLVGNTFNIYLHGTVIISVITLAAGLITAGSTEAAMRVVFEFYLASLLAWPWDELLTASSILELLVSHAVTVFVGILSATHNYWQNPGYGGR